MLGVVLATWKVRSGRRKVCRSCMVHLPQFEARVSCGGRRNEDCTSKLEEGG
jgi:hypothetical protein